MGSVNQLYRFHVPFDAEKFMQSHKDCPQDLQLLEKLWQLVQPTAFWRDAAIAENDGDGLLLDSDGLKLNIKSCYVAKGLSQCNRATVMALTIGSALPSFAAEAAADTQLRGTI